MNFLLILLTSVASLWNIKVNLDNSIDFIYNNYPILNNSCGEYLYAEKGTIVSLCNKLIYPNYTLSDLSIRTSIKLGNYHQQNITFNSINKKLPSINFVFQFPEEKENLLFYQEFSIPLQTNRIIPIKEGKVNLTYPSKRILNVPFDNDLKSFYKSEKVSPIIKGTSAYVTSIYDSSQKSNNGFTIGFLQHNIWKSGIQYTHDTISAILGINGPILTRDIEPHGIVNVTQIPHIFLSVNEDWRNGMEDYAIKISDFLSYTLGDQKPIAGWNSLAENVNKLGRPTLQRLVNSSDLFDRLPISNYNIEIGGDFFYNLSTTDTDKWIDIAHSHHQRASIHISPFIIYDYNNDYIDCGSTPCEQNSSYCWKFNEVILKNSQGIPMQPLSYTGTKVANILDVSHPITECIIEYRSLKAKLLLYDSMKLDYINVAAYEGNYFNKKIAPTGMGAYSYGLSLIDEYFSSIFNVNFAISLPLPPPKNIQSRRHGCDQMFGAVVYSMNQYAGGWWLNKFYQLHPDLVTFEGDFWFDPKYENVSSILSMDDKGRIAKAIVYGGIFKNGDDLQNKTNNALVLKYFNNSKIMNMWKLKPNFKPLSWDDNYILIGAFDPPNVFTRTNGDITIFNYGILNKRFSIDLESLFETDNITCASIFDNSTYKLKDYNLNIKVSKTSAEVMECRSH